jgi:hypothetical protein
MEGGVMKLPLHVDEGATIRIYGADGHLEGTWRPQNAADIVRAVNSEAADKAEIARLREALLTSETMALYVVDMAGGFNDVELQVVPLRRLKAIADYAHAALHMEEVTG